MFIDAPELGESRARTNHSVAGIHYYRREYVPKSTPPLSLFSLSLTPLCFTSETTGAFFHIWTDLGIFYGPFTERNDEEISGMESYSGEDLFPRRSSV